jgi:hypothetical protein
LNLFSVFSVYSVVKIFCIGGIGESRAAADRSPIPATFSPTRRRSSRFPPRKIRNVAAFLVLPARHNGDNLANFSPIPPSSKMALQN